MSCKKYSQAIALAWPETYCKCPNSWYDGLMELLGLSKGHYYKVGHAAIILIDPNKSICQYFDFGRYHAPYGYGRVRSSETDHELKIKTKGLINQRGKLLNLDEILEEISSRDVWHGQGTLNASTVKISYNNAFEKAIELQKKVFIKYGPFQFGGSNCSRFVRSVLISGSVSVFSSIKLLFPITLTPTPLTNVKSLKNIKKIDNSKFKNNVSETDPEKCNIYKFKTCIK